MRQLTKCIDSAEFNVATNNATLGIQIAATEAQSNVKVLVAGAAD